MKVKELKELLDTCNDEDNVKIQLWVRIPNHKEGGVQALGKLTGYWPNQDGNVVLVGR